MRKLTFLLFILSIFLMPAVVWAQSSKQDSIWNPFIFFTGNWQGEGKAGGAAGKYERTYQFIFNKKFIEVKNKSTYPPTAQKTDAEVHEDLGYISYDKKRKTYVLRQFHIEGFVNQYLLDTISPDGKEIIFITESIENIPSGWRAKETYRLLNENEFTETFELAAPGKEFEVYSTVNMKRIQVPETVSDTTPRVTGIGGVFIVSDNPKETNQWYQTNMGFDIDKYGAVFEYRNANKPDEVNYTSWAVFRRNNPYLEPSKKDFMINYRVHNLEGMIRNMKKNGVTVLDTIETYDYGKFVHIMDADSNKIELWEPVDSVLSKIPRKTMK